MKTDPAPPPSMSTLPPRTEDDTGPTSQSQVFQARAAIAILDALEASEETQKAMELARYAIGRAIGDAAEAEAKRSPTRLERIEAKLDKMLKMLTEREDELLKHDARLVELEAWKRRHSLAPIPRTSDDLPEIEAQEG